MSNYMRIAVMLTVALLTTQTPPALADDLVAADANAALNELYAGEPLAKMISAKAAAILVFPNIVRAGFIIGGHYGEGVLMRGGKLVAHYNSVAGSFGLQAGAQAFGYALFLMNDKALQYLDSSDGWELGVGPTIVIVDKGMAKSMTTLTLKDDVYAFIFDQKGLMAGLGIQGSKITKLEK
jgi:lipid-binding SYLF domain-containing protein